MTFGVRTSGLLLFLAAGSVAVAVYYGLFLLASRGWHIHSFELAIPGGLALAGALQAITGMSFSDLARNWERLVPWQRGVMGTLVFVGCAVIFLALVLVLLWLAPSQVVL